MKAWDRQKDLQERGVFLTYKEVQDLASRLKTPQERALFSLTYLTAGRIDEVLKVNKENITVKEFGVAGGIKKFLMVKMPNHKNRSRKWKEIPINMEKEKELVNWVIQYYNSNSTKLEMWTFKSVRRAEQLFSRYGFNPHYLRHIRTTHLITVFNLHPSLIRRILGWTDLRPARVYEDLRTEDIMEKL